MLGRGLNPLAAIAGATPSADRSHAWRERCIAIINRQNQHLQHIVNDLLDVSRLAGNCAGKEPGHGRLR
jgi:signal transduction histidine kinase